MTGFHYLSFLDQECANNTRSHGLERLQRRIAGPVVAGDNEDLSAIGKVDHGLSGTT